VGTTVVGATVVVASVVVVSVVVVSVVVDAATTAVVVVARTESDASWSLNAATFHLPTERVLSTQVARPLVEIFFGRLDARIVAGRSTLELLERFFPGNYDLVEPAAEVVHIKAFQLAQGGHSQFELLDTEHA